MYYRLNKKYSLRGWKKLPYAIVDNEVHAATFVNKTAFDALELCNGQIDLDLPLISNDIRRMVGKLEEQGIISPCSPGESIAEHQKYRRYPNRYMQMVLWSITGCCNSKCRHCYISGGENRYGEISHADAMKIAGDIRDAGVLCCSITGGDPLVRKDFWEILDCLLEGGVYVSTIYTNGYLVNDELLDDLEKRGIRPEFNMSFDGIGYHDWLRGVDGAEKAVRRAFLLCRERGFPTGSEMCLWKENFHMLRDSINFLASVGCRSVKLNPVGDIGAWREGGYQEKHGLSMEETYGIYYDYLDDFYADLPDIIVEMGGFFRACGSAPDTYTLPAVHTPGDPEKVCLCAHARNTMYISAEGRALMCMPFSCMDDFQKDYPKVQEIGLQACMTDSQYLELVNLRAARILEHNTKCRECPYKRVCLGGCRAEAMGSHPGDVLAPAEGNCKFFRDGWIPKIVDKVRSLRPEASCARLADLESVTE